MVLNIEVMVLFMRKDLTVFEIIRQTNLYIWIIPMPKYMKFLGCGHRPQYLIAVHGTLVMSIGAAESGLVSCHDEPEMAMDT